MILPVLNPAIFLPAKRPPVASTKRFELASQYQPAGDQPQAIAALTEGVRVGEREQVLLGVTGSGKTFTIANVIANVQRPTLILAPNKILAAQLYAEMKGFFPENAVEYFVSYYDYYQPEAYVPRTDTYIAKDWSINEQIDRMRHSATRALLERNDVIIVASVSCIYGIGAVETYAQMVLSIDLGQRVERKALLQRLVELQYKRNDLGFARGFFRAPGDVVEVFPSHLEDRAWKLSMFGDEVEAIWEIDPLTGEKTAALEQITIYPNSHYVTPRPTLQQAIPRIKAELKARVDEFVRDGHLLEAQRLQERTTYDHGDAGDGRLLQRHRELLTLSHRTQSRRAAADAVRVHSRERAADRRREPRHRAAARRDVSRRLPAQVDARRVRLPPAVVQRTTGR